MKRILITGAAGKIGSVLQFFAPAGARYGRVPVPASSSEPREIHTVMVPPPDGRGERIHPRYRRSLHTARHAPQ